MSDETSPKETTTDDLPRERACGTMKVHRRLLDQDPHYGRRLARIEDQAFRARSGIALRPGCVKIPVVVHVVHKTSAENISQAQIDSQIAILNRDFRKRNADVSAVPAVFAALAGDARVEFELAHTDPDGNPTNGVTRTKTESSSFSDDDDVKFTARGGQDAWPADEYLNVWVCRLSGGLLGYAQFPGGPAETDGVVITHTAFGDTGTAAAPFNLGRTTTHEIGHWLNLRHIWGDDFEGCSGSDFVDDTPNQGGSNIGKPTFPHVSCNNGPNGDLFMNYMDYVDDDTMVMFTLGQISRMQACLDGARSTIGEPIPCVGITPKGPVKEPPKELVKDFPKDPIKDRPKEFVKEPIKDFIKEPPKEWLKDLPKDPIKDGPKDFGKEPPKDFGKEGIADPPKPIGLEPPVAFPPDVINPVVNPAVSPVATPNVPFVMGTGAGGFTDAELAPPASLQQGRGQGLADHYRLILSQYAALHRAGKLDEAGLASWQETWNAYQQLGGAS